MCRVADNDTWEMGYGINRNVIDNHKEIVIVQSVEKREHSQSRYKLKEKKNEKRN